MKTATPTTVRQMLAQIDELSDDEVMMIYAHIQPRVLTHEKAQTLADIRAIYQDVPPTQLTSGTMNIEKLEQFLNDIRSQFSDADWDDITRAMKGD